jgi:hypothetical protein
MAESEYDLDSDLESDRKSDLKSNPPSNLTSNQIRARIESNSNSNEVESTIESNSIPTGNPTTKKIIRPKNRQGGLTATRVDYVVGRWLCHIVRNQVSVDGTR